MTTGVLLVNLGTPVSAKPRDVHTYLTEFLTDPRVIDIPFVPRQLLVRGVIVPKRYKTSSASYQEIWGDQGSPLMQHSLELKSALQERLGDDYTVELAMRYQQPSIASALERLKKSNVHELIILPLFPQYASATVGSIYENVFSHMKNWLTLPNLRIINAFYNHPLMIEAICDLARKRDYQSYDHILISFHGLPVNQLKKSDEGNHCQRCNNCCQRLTQDNQHCYGAQCYQTAYSIAKGLRLNPSQYSVCFQSRLGKTPWIEPYASDVIRKLALENKKRVLVISPSFVCDCLETLFEIGKEYAHEFKGLGGKDLDLLPGLNTHPLWIEALEDLIKNPSKHGLPYKRALISQEF